MSRALDRALDRAQHQPLPPTVPGLPVSEAAVPAVVGGDITPPPARRILLSTIQQDGGCVLLSLRLN